MSEENNVILASLLGDIGSPEGEAPTTETETSPEVDRLMDIFRGGDKTKSARALKQLIKLLRD